MVGIFPINFWAVLVFLNKFPAYLKHLTWWDTLGILAYQLAFALLESILLCVLLTLIAFILPASWFSNRYKSQSTGAILLMVFLLIVLQMLIIYAFNNAATSQDGSLLSEKTLFSFIIWGFCFFFFFLVTQYWLAVSEGLQKKISEAADRFMVASAFFLILDFLGALVVFSRNLL